MNVNTPRRNDRSPNQEEDSMTGNPLKMVEAEGLVCPVLSCAVCGDPVTLTDHAVWTYPDNAVQVGCTRAAATTLRRRLLLDRDG
jgi:hypothetical protein